MLKGFKSYTRKLDWILSCCIEILSRMPDEGDGDESSNGFQQQKFLEYTLFARIILLRGNSFMWKNCSWISWLKYHIMSIIIETLGFFLAPPQNNGPFGDFEPWVSWILFYIFLFIVRRHNTAHRGQKTTCGSQFSYHMGSGCQAQVIRLGRYATLPAESSHIITP